MSCEPSPLCPANFAGHKTRLFGGSLKLTYCGEINSQVTKIRHGSIKRLGADLQMLRSEVRRA